MMVSINNVQIVDPEAGTDFQGAVRIENGAIIEIVADGAFSSGEIIDGNGKYLAPGIIDIGVKVSEPGERQKESFATAGRAAAAGGVTTMVTRPDTLPPIDTPEALQFLHRRAVDDAVVNVVPMACLTKGRNGREMTEIGFLKDAGAVAFSDSDRPVRDAKVFLRALSYASMMDVLVIGHCQDPDLSAGAVTTSGPFSTKQGLPSVSPIAEQIQMERDLALAQSADVRFHVDQVSTAAGVEVLARAKAGYNRITAGVSVHHLTLNEFDVGDYRTFFKVKPPLRAETDRMAVVEALARGDIDIISSMHTPQDEEEKRLPFTEAASGAVALETLLPACLQLVHGQMISLPQLIKALTFNPARLLGLSAGRMAVGAPADLMLFDPFAPFVMQRSKLLSKSKNTPYDLARMQGRVLRTFVAGKQVFCR